MKLQFSTPIPLPFQKVRDQFNEALFVYLAPPLIPFELIRFDGCKKNHEVHISLGVKPFTQTWVSLITFEESNSLGWSFIDEGKRLPWPLKYWKHHHKVDKISDQECMIVDDITFECQSTMMSFMIWPFLWWVFSLRPKRYRRYFIGTV
jgi:ligand-binding SRPBCC domain-containing protein